jgi:hypothetical protein
VSYSYAPMEIGAPLYAPLTSIVYAPLTSPRVLLLGTPPPAASRQSRRHVPSQSQAPSRVLIRVSLSWKVVTPDPSQSQLEGRHA